MSKRLNALRAERDGVQAALTAIEDKSVDALGRALEMDDEAKAEATTLLTREGELTSEIEKLWKVEEGRQASAGIVAKMEQARDNGLVRAGLGADLTGISPGEYALEFLKANLKADPGSLERLTTIHRAQFEQATALGRASDLTTDITGVLPTFIVGDLIKFVDASRNVVNACREIPMPPNGKSFTRPRVSQRTTAGQQTEGSALSSQKMTVTSDTVTKTAQGGFVTLTEQDIDWTDPAFLQILIEDLAESYAIQTDDVLASAIETASTTNKTTGFTPGTSAWTVFYAKLIAAATTVYSNAKKLPDTLFLAPDVWGDIVGYLDTTNRPIFPYMGPNNAPGGTVEITSFGGSPLGLNVVVDPNFTAAVCVVAVSRLCEYSEFNKGLASIAAPSTMAVDVAYRGYFAANVYAQGLSSMQTA